MSSTVYIPHLGVYAIVVATYDSYDSLMVLLPNGQRVEVYADQVRYVAPPARQAVACG